MAFTLTFLPLCSPLQTALIFVFGNAQCAAKPPHKNFAPQLFYLPWLCFPQTQRQPASQWSSSVVWWLCWSMCSAVWLHAPKTEAESRHESAKPPCWPISYSYTKCETESNTEREGERREGKSKGIERKRDRGRNEERMQKAKCCHTARDQTEGGSGGNECEWHRQTERGGWRREKSESEGAMRLWIIQNELKGGRDMRRGETGSGSH